MCGVKRIKNQAVTTGLNIVIGNPECVVEILSSVIGDNLILLLTEQFTIVKMLKNE
jgi:hypothetical protein